jgi:hypothetical protein
MESNHPPYCPDCIVPLTVSHVLSECPSSLQIRLRCFPGSLNLDPPDILSLMLAEHPTDGYSVAPLLKYLNATDLLAEI